MPLPAGANRVLVKVVKDTSEMGIALAVTDPEGRPLPGLRSLSGREALHAGCQVKDSQIVVLLTAVAPLPAQSAGERPSRANLARQLEFVEQHRHGMRAAAGLWSLRRLMWT